jgi:hypothetical protein
LFKYFSFVLIQKKQKIKARDCTLVSPFPHLLSLCFVGDLSASSKTTMLSSVWKPEHPSARERFLLVRPFDMIRPFGLFRNRTQKQCSDVLVSAVYIFYERLFY